MFFRVLVLFFTVASIVLSVWSLVGSYKNESYLTDNYLLSFQLSNLNLTALFQDGIDSNSKRDYIPPEAVFAEVEQGLRLQPTKTIMEKRDVDIASLAAQYTSILDSGDVDASSVVASVASQYSVGTSDIASITSAAKAANLASEAAAYASTASIPDSIVSLASEITGDLSSILSNIADSANVSDLGLSDMYSVSFYGYCKGDLDSELKKISGLGKFGKQFENSNVNWTYCSSPKLGYKFDPLTLLKTEITQEIKDYTDGLSTLTGGLSDTFIAELLTVVSSITYDDVGLPGDLKKNINLLHRCTVAGYSLIFAGACLAFISFMFQIAGLCCSPNNSFLSCCNFIVMTVVALVIVLGSGLTTGVYMYVRRTVNNALDEYDVKSYLSIQFYAFSWSAAVCAILFVVFSIIGYCCGCFHSNRNLKFGRRREPELTYVHKA